LQSVDHDQAEQAMAILNRLSLKYGLMISIGGMGMGALRKGLACSHNTWNHARQRQCAGGARIMDR